MTTFLENLADAGARFILCYPRTKKPIGEGWQLKPHNLHEALQHLRSGGNVGLMAGELSQGLIAIDLDDRAPEFAAQYPELAVWRVYRVNAPERAKYIIRSPSARNQKDKKVGIEILAFGNAVVAGIHETGTRVEMALSGAVPVVTSEYVANIFRRWTGRTEEPAVKPARIKGFVSSSTPNCFAGKLFAIRIMLEHLPSANADDYNEWVRIGHIIKYECGEAGFNLWDAWSRTSPKYAADDAYYTWNSIKPRGDVTLGTLRFLADKGGTR